MIYKEGIESVYNEELQSFCTKIGSISSPIIRELALPNYDGREVRAEKYIDDKNNIVGVSILIKEGECEKAILGSKEPNMKMIEVSDFNPHFWMLPSTLSLHELGWNAIMDGNYYSDGSYKKRKDIIIDDLDLEWKVFEKGINEDGLWSSERVQELINDSESPIIRADLFKEWLLKECFIIICIQGGKPIGIVSACTSPLPVVNFLYCIDKYRGNGIGSELLVRLRNEINKKACVSVFAMSPKDKEDLYYKSGFKSDQSWRLWMK